MIFISLIFVQNHAPPVGLKDDDNAKGTFVLMCADCFWTIFVWTKAAAADLRDNPNVRYDFQYA